MIVRLESYKVAKFYLESYPAIKSALDQSYATLLPFAVFSPVADVLRSIRDQRVILDIKKEKAEEIVNRSSS